MNAPARLTAFAAVLAVVFGLSAFAGSRIDAHPGEPVAEKGHARAMGGMPAGDGDGGTAPQPVRGLAVSENGLTLALARRAVARGERFELAFQILDRRGRAVRDFDVEHTKRMHVIVARRDMTGFQHLHPIQRRDGTWSVPARLRAAGSYRVYADFSADGKAYTLADDLAVDGPVRWRALPGAAGGVDVDGLHVVLAPRSLTARGASALTFAVTRGRKPVAVEDYLGAKGHLVALREGDLAFLHVHPDERALEFMATFPTAGSYRLFLQFKTDGRVHTAAFTREVTR